ncbi:Protein MAIN-LIKE 2 [Linum perenne]
MRQRSTSLRWSPQYLLFLEGCRLSGVLPVIGQTPCKELVTALIERWRPETNTFHLIPGEATITLEDVEVLTGLPTTGRPILVSPDEQPVPEICQQWLGIQPPPNAVQGRTVKVAWVKRLFDRLPDGASVEVITYHARAYTWVLVAGVLLADRNGDHIPVHLLQLIGDPRVAATYSWGSAVLAWLYKVMGRAAFFCHDMETPIHGVCVGDCHDVVSTITPARGMFWWHIYVHALFRGSLSSIDVFIVTFADVIVDIRISFVLRAMASFVTRVIGGDVCISRQPLLIVFLHLRTYMTGSRV